MLFAFMEFFAFILLCGLFYTNVVYFLFSSSIFNFSNFISIFSFLFFPCYIACLIKYVSTTYIIGIPLAAAEPCGTMDTMRVRVCHIC